MLVRGLTTGEKSMPMRLTLNRRRKMKKFIEKRSDDKTQERSAPSFKSAIPPAEFSKKPPAAKSWHGAEKVWVHLLDECPRIGSGYRLVWAKPGRIWVRLCDPTGNRGKLRRDVFEVAVRDEF